MDDLTVLFGGVDVAVAYADNSPDTVKVRQLKISELPKYAGLAEDDAKCIELFCDKPPGWSDSLSLPSALLILETGHKLNGDFLARSAARKTALREQLVPGYRDLLAKVLDSRLGSSLPGSPSKPA